MIDLAAAFVRPVLRPSPRCLIWRFQFTDNPFRYELLKAPDGWWLTRYHPRRLAVVEYVGTSMRGKAAIREHAGHYARYCRRKSE